MIQTCTGLVVESKKKTYYKYKKIDFMSFQRCVDYCKTKSESINGKPLFSGVWFLF